MFIFFSMKSSEKVVNKKNKEHRPASQRVAEVAEYLMCVLFEHKVRSFLYVLRIKSVFRVSI